jgi:vacuolar-type H+-ATPase subunit I/STV1
MSKLVQAADAISAISAGAAGDAKPRTALASDGIDDTIQRLAGRSADQIDRLIAELTQLRERLQTEGERVQHEIVRVRHQIAGYMETNDAVMESTQRIGQALAQFKGAASTSQSH